MMTKHIRRHTGTRRRLEWRLIPIALSLLCLSGCQSLFGFTWIKPGSYSPAELRGDEEIEELASTDDVRGPLESRLRRMGFRFAKDKKDTGTSLKAVAGREELAKLQKLFEQKQYSTVERRAKKLADKHKDSPVREDALFLTAEAQFHQKRYSWAADSYQALGKEFPATRYQSTRNRRLFAIARIWLNDTEYVTTDDVELASHDENGQSRIDVKKKKAGTTKDPSRLIPIIPNLWDRTRPVFDTEGRALQALKSIWQYDPTGPLADDALMLTASYYIRKRNFIEADHIYQILRQEYPKSPHARNAFVLGSFVKRASYQGPSYDGTALDEAQELNESTLRLFPDHPDRDRIRNDMRKIEEYKAAQEWANVVFYQRKGRPRSVAVCAHEVIRLYPNSTYADRARQLLRKMRAEAQPEPPPKSTPDNPDGPGAPRRLFNLPKFALPALPKFGREEPEQPRPRVLDSRSASEKTPGRVRL